MLVKSQRLNKLLLKSAYINYKPTIFPVEIPHLFRGWTGQDPVLELLRSAARSAVPTEEERRIAERAGSARQGGNPLFRRCYAGVGKCPMTWEYWTSPEKVAIIDHIPNGWVMWKMGTFNDPCYDNGNKCKEDTKEVERSFVLVKELKMVIAMSGRTLWIHFKFIGAGLAPIR